MILTAILQSRIVRWIGAAIMGAMALLGWRALERRDAANDERAKEAARDAKETIKAHEVRDAVEDDVSRGGNARDRLRSDWRE